MSEPRRVRILTADADATRALGRALGGRLRAGDVVLLHGDLGAGKTTLAQGIAAGLGVRGPVQSPTFVLASEYRPDGEGPALHHLDLYRLDDPGEIAALGYEEYLDPADAVTLVEWPERAGGMLPDAFLLVELEPVAGGRAIVLTAAADGAAAARWLDGLDTDGA